MTKVDIVDAFAKEFGFSFERARILVNAVLSRIVDGAVDEGRVEIRGLGVFYLVETRAHKTSNHLTKAVVDVPARRSLRFRQSSTVADRLNGTAVETNGSTT